jgi:hypothetical protein
MIKRDILAYFVYEGNVVFSRERLNQQKHILFLIPIIKLILFMIFHRNSVLAPK